MTREEFIKVLEKSRYNYREVGDRIIITSGNDESKGDIRFGLWENIPPNLEFRNSRHVILDSLTKIPDGTIFRNGGDVYLSNLKELSGKVEFRNRGDVYFQSLTSISTGPEFHNRYNSLRPLLKSEDFDDWKGNIEGIDSNELLNNMISNEIFDKKKR
jgi:hypothetical protein